MFPARTLIGFAYRVFIEWVLGVELPWRLTIGPGLRLYHGVGTVVNDGCVIGSNVTLRHNVTIGHTKAGGPCPIIHDGVDIGAGAIIIGGITIGANARIGAGALVVHDVPAGATVVSTPSTSRP
jgi:putative colanic acid biosynthesis acetyltransferase WcaB